ncbi:hypothetical protein MRB53_041135 [Persea americana]|nr:hypothetical protein MRB53_041135 [Persea americana]
MFPARRPRPAHRALISPRNKYHNTNKQDMLNRALLLNQRDTLNQVLLLSKQDMLSQAPLHPKRLTRDVEEEQMRRDRVQLWDEFNNVWLTHFAKSVRHAGNDTYRPTTSGTAVGNDIASFGPTCTRSPQTLR